MNKLKLQELEQRIDEVLFYVWDPIGVSDYPAARGEYRSYIGTILKLVLTEDRTKLGLHLDKLQSGSMGLTPNPEKNIEIAEQLIDYKHAVEKGLS